MNLKRRTSPNPCFARPKVVVWIVKVGTCSKKQKELRSLEYKKIAFISHHHIIQGRRRPKNTCSLTYTKIGQDSEFSSKLISSREVKGDAAHPPRVLGSRETLCPWLPRQQLLQGAPLQISPSSPACAGAHMGGNPTAPYRRRKEGIVGLQNQCFLLPWRRNWR